ncbi:MAG: AAA family ATPase [Planctomycetes bacterium]|nr:AAA family ATPase [Planctomycetota bacterium]
MLVKLELHNFLLFEHAAFDFSSGLNAVSGETGAGKSLVARALALTLGGRGGHDAIRSGCEESRIRAWFRPGAKSPRAVREWINPDGLIEVERVVRAGSGVALVNGKQVPAQTVRQTLSPLVDFAAQNEHMRLADPTHQRELLDAYGKLENALAAYAEAYRGAETLHKRLTAGREERELVALRLSRAREELAELDKVGFDPKTDTTLEEEITEMSHSTAVLEAAAEAAAFLEAGEPSSIEGLGAAWRAAEKMAAVSPRLADAARELSEAQDKAQSALSRLSEIPDEVDADPDRLDRMIARSEKLKSLAKRFACQVGELDKARQKLANEIEDLSGWETDEEEVRTQLRRLLPSVRDAGVALGEKRRQAALKLEKAVNRELAGLGMAEAGFQVVFEPLWQDGMPLDELLETGPAGLDEISFFLSPNPGEAAAAISAGASGGETSRAVLAIKAALSQVYKPELMFLDEIDAGVGARLGRELGGKLRELAQNRQVIVITHLPQIAASAHTHLKVAKKVKSGRTSATVAALSGGEREKEIASMIHGSAANEVTLRQAREMLTEAGAAG